MPLSKSGPGPGPGGLKTAPSRPSSRTRRSPVHDHGCVLPATDEARDLSDLAVWAFELDLVHARLQTDERGSLEAKLAVDRERARGKCLHAQLGREPEHS